MLSSEIVGIFLGEQGLSCAFLKRQFNKWIPWESPVFGEAGGRTSVERLGGLLSNLTPKKSRRLCIALPRSRYYLRDLNFKGLSPDEAESAVRLSIATHAHLPPDEIYYDCWAYQKAGSTRVLLAYAKRSFIDAIIEQVERAGHKKSLFVISPLGVGTDLLLRKGAEVSFPCASICREEEEDVVNLHGSSGWLGCHPVKSAGANVTEALERLGFGSDSPIVAFGTLSGEREGNRAWKNPCDDPGIAQFCGSSGWSPGLSAAFLGTSSFPQFSFQQRPRRKPLHHRINAFQLVLVGLAIILALYTGSKFLALKRVSSQYNRNLAVIKRLEARYRPLKSKLERLDKLRALEKDMLDFVRERPPLLEILKELAQRTPTDAWIKYFTLKNNVLKVSAEGGSAVSTMESWRKSRLFSSVKLASPVTKDRQGRERYTVELIIRSPVQQKAGKK